MILEVELGWNTIFWVGESRPFDPRKAKTLLCLILGARPAEDV